SPSPPSSRRRASPRGRPLAPRFRRAPRPAGRGQGGGAPQSPALGAPPPPRRDPKHPRGLSRRVRRLGPKAPHTPGQAARVLGITPRRGRGAEGRALRRPPALPATGGPRGAAEPRGERPPPGRSAASGGRRGWG